MPTPKGVSVTKTDANKADLSESSSLYYDKTEIVESLFRVSEKYTSQLGYLYITSYKMKFIPDKAIDTGFLSVPFGYVHTITEIPHEQKVIVKCKDERAFKFKFDVPH